MTLAKPVPRAGKCHCGSVEIRVTAPLEFVLDCNCSMCTMKGTLHWIVEVAEFELIAGEDSLRCYQFGTKAAKHYFCERCGISPYYIPRSHPDKVDVNLRCVSGVDLDAVERRSFDGANWEQARAELKS